MEVQIIGLIKKWDKDRLRVDLVSTSTILLVEWSSGFCRMVCFLEKKTIVKPVNRLFLWPSSEDLNGQSLLLRFVWMHRNDFWN
jgi:hypothetical protein